MVYHEQIDNDPQRIKNIYPFINHYAWEDIEFPAHARDWKKFEINNKSIALNVLFIPHKKEDIRQTYISLHNSEHPSQMILLMSANGEKWH